MKEEPTVIQPNPTPTELPDINGMQPQPMPPSDMGAVPVGQPPKKSKKKWLWVLLVLILIGGGAAAAYQFVYKKGANDQTPVTTTSTAQTQKPATQSNEQMPFAVAYSYMVDKKPTNVCGQSQSTTYWRPVGGGDRTLAEKFGINNDVDGSDIYKNKILLTVSIGCGSKDGSSIWYSNDSGKSYKKVFETAPPEQVNREQITSAKFANDGKTILFAFLPADGSKNIVKEINPETKVAKNLFSVKLPGVFIQGYNREANQVLYYSGCYGCDGVTFNTLRAHNLSDNTDKVLYEAPEQKYGSTTDINDEFTKLAQVLSSPGLLLGGAPPYTVQELNLADGKAKKIATISQDKIVEAGYREGDNMFYYLIGNKIFGYSPISKPSLLFDSSKPIFRVNYLDESQVVFSSGKYDDYKLINFNFKTKKSVNILNGDDKTHIFGVTWK